MVARYPTPVFLIDGSIYIFQAHFSPNIEIYDDERNELSAVYGFTQFLLQFLRRTGATHLAVALDESLFCGFRHSLCPNYKSNRELPDDNLAMQLGACNEVCEVLGVQRYASRTYEADDIIGTLSASIRNQTGGACNIEIVSRDKDLSQLLEHEKDCLWDYSGNRKRYLADVVDELGIYPAQIPDYLGLIGDSVDCIRGVPGIGPVKAKLLLQHFRDLDTIYSNLDKIADLPIRGAPRLVNLLDQHRELAELSKRLATIVCHVDEPEESFATIELDGLQRRKIDTALLDKFISRYGFQEDEANRLRYLASSVDSK